MMTSNAFIRQMSSKEFRDAFTADQTRLYIALMIPALRHQRGWSQADLGKRAGKPQNVISRVEDPDYGKVTLQTLLDLAAAFDLPLMVEMPEWDDWYLRMNKITRRDLARHSFDVEFLIEKNRNA